STETVEMSLPRSHRSGGDSPLVWPVNLGCPSVRQPSSSASWPPGSSGPRSDSTRPRSSASSPNRRRASTSCPSISHPGNRSRSGSWRTPSTPMRWSRSEERRVGKECGGVGEGERSSRRRHTRSKRDWSSDVCSSDLVILGVMASGFIGSSIGLDQTEKFRVQSESAQGLDVLSEHFPPGESQPIWIVADTEHADEVVDSVGGLDGVVRASAIDEATVDGASVTKIMVTGEFEPDSAKGLELVEDI